MKLIQLPTVWLGPRGLFGFGWFNTKCKLGTLIHLFQSIALIGNVEINGQYIIDENESP